MEDSGAPQGTRWNWRERGEDGEGDRRGLRWQNPDLSRPLAWPRAPGSDLIPEPGDPPGHTLCTRKKHAPSRDWATD